MKVEVDEQVKLVRDAMSYLQSQGVTPIQPGPGEKPDKNMRSLRELLASGKQLAPLSEKDQGAALTYLSQFQYSLSTGKPLSREEALFVSRVYNSYEIGQKGLPSQFSGRYEGEGGEASREALLQEMTRLYMSMAGFDEKTAREYAEQYLRDQEAVGSPKPKKQSGSYSAGSMSEKIEGKVPPLKKWGEK